MRRGRHSRKGDDYWDSQPSRSDELAAAVRGPSGRVPGRKDRWARCKANGGKPHSFRIIPDPGHGPYISSDCRWLSGWNLRTGPYYSAFWRCRHHEACEYCGKESRSSVEPGECPAYPGTGEQRARAQADADRMTERHLNWKPRKPAPSGSQGYRRKKAAS